MNKQIRPLAKEDFSLYQTMETGLQEDYMLRLFPGLTSGENRLYGLFIDEQLVSTAGYTVFAHHYIMLGRLRSDKRFRGNNYGTEILQYAKDQALQLQDVSFVGANTEAHNHSAQKVLAKIGLPHVITLFAAQTTNLSSLVSSKAASWSKIENIGRKLEWLKRTYLNEDFPETIFPFEAYYPFPASEDLFKEETVRNWQFYENASQTRYLILWEEDKGDHYLHITYPWSDFMEQEGFWTTVASVYEGIQRDQPETILWIDLTREEAALLPADHPFELPSPWMLHGVHPDKPAERPDEPDVGETLDKAFESLEFLEQEIQDLEQELNETIQKTDTLKQTLDELDTDS
ncbi:GNAT family N-acetyltransferase [Marinilactibacillus piezotolerans]|uniref:GNAT family N-acetyltransferase n=1 Tax=Marinilactibacillus piezotolerans TaxID=258723 RepID=UPI0009B04277|nr:GNAT family N-acetyltransferase [Marinilactibacillus piezotolerans]